MRILRLQVLISIITSTYSGYLQSQPEFPDKPKSVISKGGPLCDLEKFSEPYIRVSKRRNGDSLVHIKKTGFIDMTRLWQKGWKFPENDYYISLLSSVVTYAGYEDIGPGISREFLWTNGLQLVAQPEDFYERTAKFFPMDNYGHISKNREGVKAISFVTVGEGPFCLKLNDTLNVIIGGQPKRPSVCKWTLSEDFSVTDGFINRDRWIKPVSNLRTCSSRGPSYSRSIRNIPWDLLIQRKATLMWDFRCIPNLSISNPQVTIINGTFSVFQAEFDFFDDGDTFINTLTNLGYMGEEPDYDEGHPTMFPIRVDPSKCISLNPKPSTVSDSCLKKDKNIACTLLQLALHLTPPGLRIDEVTLTGELAWKDEILNLIADIFSRICLPFPKEMAFNVAKMFAYYLVKAHDTDYDLPVHRRSTWDFLKSELEMCRSKQIESDDVFNWHWDIRDGDHDPKYLPGPILTEEEKRFANLTKSTPCLALECSMDCIAVRETCIPANEAREYCSSRNEANCTSANQCIFNTEHGVCSPISDCEALDCFHAGPKTICQTKGDKCVATRSSAQPIVKDIPAFNFNPDDFPYADETDDSDVQFDEPIIYSPAPKSQIYVDPEDVMRYDAKYNSYPYNLFAITNKKSLNKSADPNDPNLSDLEGRCVYHFEEAVETEHDLHIIIDAFWKISLTVFGYCNKHHPQRKQETFSRLYNTFAEDFLQSLYQEWANPTDNDELKLIFRGLNSDISSRWLDSCVETAFIVSDSLAHRIQRPLPVGEEGTLQPNYFTKYINSVEDALFGTKRIEKASDGCIEF